MVFPEDHGEGRVCICCGGPVSRYNPNPWCYSCHKYRRFNRTCEICGKKLTSIEHERCSSCDEKNPWPPGTTYYAPLSAKKILDSSRPLKPGPGGLKSKNRIGLTIIQVKETLREELRKRIDRLSKLRKPIRIAEENAEFLRSHGEHAEANIFAAEAAKLKEANREVIEKLESEISRIMDAISAVNEVAHEQVNISSSVRKGKTAVTWVPIAPFTQDDIEELIRSLREN
jgi:Asp-tRNA(Asn)/Glu-tRNA(Gln) amidotransferase C subunit